MVYDGREDSNDYLRGKNDKTDFVIRPHCFVGITEDVVHVCPYKA